MKLKRILVCPDSFKGSLTAREAANAIVEGLKAGGFQGEIIVCPLSDGGEGMLDVIWETHSLQCLNVTTVDPLGNEIRAEYLIDVDSGSAYIESARMIGLDLVSPQRRNPFNASSKGLGIAIIDALKHGVKDVYVTLGGSAVCDGGMGMLTAMGTKFYDRTNKMLFGKAGSMNEIDHIVWKGQELPPENIRFYAVCDVDNPLLGNMGAINVFAPQKGASIYDIPILEKGMENLVNRCVEAGVAQKSDAYKEGAGAAGGVGFAMFAFLKAQKLSGIDFVLDRVKFDSLLSNVDYVLTGEGKIDRQSMMGKVLSGVIERARHQNKPVIAFGGLIEDRGEIEKFGLKQAIEISDPNLSISRNMEKETASYNLQLAACNFILNLIGT